MVIKEDIKEINNSLEQSGLGFKDRRVLVTGGAGFLGSWVCGALVEQGAEVACLDNFSSGLASNIKELKGRNFTVINHDISKPIEFEQRFDMVFHLASRASPFEFEKYPIQILKANTLGIWVALGIAKKHGARFLYASTSEVYGDAESRYIPTPETYTGNVNPIGPRSCYDEAKRAGEAFVIAYKSQHGMDTRIVRIFNTYGPRIRADDIYGRVVSRFIEQALSNKPITVFGNGLQTRSFTYVSDEVEGILRLASLDEAEGRVVNIGNDKETKIIELAEIVKKLTGSKSEISFHPLPQDDPKRRCPDITLARKTLGWEPKVDLESGLTKTIKWFSEVK